MKIRPEYAHLVEGSKTGAGVQGPTDLDRLTATVDRVLVLDHDVEHYCPHFGPRAWVRLMHDSHGGWKDPAEHAYAILPVIVKAYGYGVRDFISGNEQIALEGLGDSADDYRFLNWWGVEHLRTLRAELRGQGIYHARFWGPALSPGHNEDDNGEHYRLLAGYLGSLDGIAIHNYWRPDGGFIGYHDFEWWAGRIERAHRLISSMGITRPFSVTEFNRKVDRADPADVVSYGTECQMYYQWLNSLDYVVAGFTFLYTCQDEAFADLTWDRMPGMVERMQGFDRLGEWGQLPPEPPEEEFVIDKDKILASIDTLWGIANGLDTRGEDLKQEAQRIRDYIVQIKQAAGLDDPLAP